MGADYFVGFYGIKIALSPDDEDTQDVDARLQQAGFREKPALHFQLEAKY